VVPVSPVLAPGSVWIGPFELALYGLPPTASSDVRRWASGLVGAGYDGAAAALGGEVLGFDRAGHALSSRTSGFFLATDRSFSAASEGWRTFVSHA